MLRRQANYGWVFSAGIFLISLLYFGLFNRFHIISQEKHQLFRFSLSYFAETLKEPGGFIVYTGSFFTQFFILPWIGAFIISAGITLVFQLSDYINKQHRINSVVPALLTSWFLIILQGNELFTFSQCTGLIISFLFFAVYISLKTTSRRYTMFMIGWPVLYLLTGGFSLPVTIMCIIHELLYRKQERYLTIAIFYLTESLLIPVLFSEFLFYMPISGIFLHPVITELRSLPLVILILLIAWTPMLLLTNRVSDKYLNNNPFQHKERLFRQAASGILYLILTGSILLIGYNKNAEKLLGLVHYSQEQEWDKVIKLSSGFDHPNRLIIYYTNLALYKSGMLLDKMFGYPQTGSDGLRLKWEHSTNLVFGGDVFYHLGYTSEATRWAFEAMEAEGMNPVLMKRLAATAIINNEYKLAGKYLHYLDQTLFYHRFAQEQIKWLNNPDTPPGDPDILRNRSLLIKKDIVANPVDLNLISLMANHDENRMAYEYLLASLLLDQQLKTLISVLPALHDFRYTSVPVHIEEALLLYSLIDNRNPLPAGFSIRAETIKRFRDYSSVYATYRNNHAQAAKALKSEFGNTYWYYVQFVTNP